MLIPDPLLRPTVAVFMIGALWLPPRASVTGQEWTIEDIVATERVMEVAISPDGSKVAWILARMNEELGAPLLDLQLTDVDTAATVRLTRDVAAESRVQWSPSGRRISFLTTRTANPVNRPQGATNALAQSQLWLFDVRGG